MRISDWSSDVCSSDLDHAQPVSRARPAALHEPLCRGHHLLLLLLCRGRLQSRGNRRESEARSEERRVGNECVSTCRSRWSTSHYTRNIVYDRKVVMKTRHKEHSEMYLLMNMQS